MKTRLSSVIATMRTERAILESTINETQDVIKHRIAVMDECLKRIAPMQTSGNEPSEPRRPRTRKPKPEAEPTL